MYRVCLLDDQPFVREGLRDMIDWASLECEIVADWGTAAQAVREIGEARPDILISDIVMPGLDGLSLMEMIRQSQMSVQVIFLSAYRNFDYAQRALELGAVEYLVKPTDPKEVVRAVAKCIRRIHESSSAQGQTGSAAAEDQSQYEKELEKRLLGESAESGPAAADPEAAYIVFAIRPDDPVRPISAFRQSAEMLRRKCNPQYKPAVLSLMDKVIVVYRAKDRTTLSRMAMEWAEEIVFWHRQLLDIPVSVGISTSRSGVAQLHLQFQEAQKALEMSFYYGKGSIVSSEQAKTGAPGPTGAMQPESAEHREKQLLQAIREEDEEKIVRLLESWFDEFKTQKTGETEIKFQVFKWIFYVFSHLPEEWVRKQGWEQKAQPLLTARSLVEIKEILGELVTLAVEPFRSNRVDHHSVTMRQVETFIREHYMRPDTSLTDLAEYVHLSPNYVSRLIKQRAGKTFTEWLNEYRMEMAKTLLKQKQSKSYWVAEKVGIPDARYFSQLFRKYTNLTPTEFKARALGNGGPSDGTADAPAERSSDQALNEMPDVPAEEPPDGTSGETAGAPDEAASGRTFNGIPGGSAEKTSDRTINGTSGVPDGTFDGTLS